MDAGVPIYGYQVILDPIIFTEMEMAGENLHMNIRKANKRLVGPLDIQQASNTNYNDWSTPRKRRNPSPLAYPFAFAFPNAFAQPDPAPMPLVKKYGNMDSPRGYTFYGGRGFRHDELVPSSQDSFQDI